MSRGSTEADGLSVSRPVSISVVMPLYNKAPHVGAAIESVLRQTAPCAELIVVDDGSTDGGLEYVRSLAHPLLSLHQRSEPGPGGYAARNLAIKTAQGDWIAFLDADDIWSDDHLATIQHVIRDSPHDVGCVFTRYAYVSGERQRRNGVSEGLIRRAGRPLSFDDFLEAWLEARACPIWTGAVAFRRSVLVEAGLFPEGRARRGGDKDLWLRAASRTKSVFSPKLTAHFMQDTVNKVTKTTSFTLPCVVQTIQDTLPQQAPRTQHLLRRLANHELGQYAKWSIGQDRINPDLARSIMLPEGAGRLLFVWLIAATPRGFRKLIVQAQARRRLRKGSVFSSR